MRLGGRARRGYRPTSGMGADIGVDMSYTESVTNNVAADIIPFQSSALFYLDGEVLLVGSDYYLKDQTGNGRHFKITNYDWAEDYFDVDVKLFPWKTKATITAPVADAVLIAADTGNFFYDIAGDPIALRPQYFFNNINYENQIFCSEVEQTIVPLDDADVTIRGIELTPAGLKYITMYSSALTGDDIATANTFYGVPVKDTANSYWVAKDGDDTTGDGSEALPYLTINKAVLTVNQVTGKTIYIKNGTYIEDSGAGGLTVTWNPAGVKTLKIQGLGGVYETHVSGYNSIIIAVGATSLHPTFTIDINNISITGLVNARFPLQLTSASNNAVILNLNKCYVYGKSSASYNTITLPGNAPMAKAVIDKCCVRNDTSEWVQVYNDTQITNSYFNHIRVRGVKDGQSIKYCKFDAENTTRTTLLYGLNCIFILNASQYIRYNIFYYGDVACYPQTNTNAGNIYVEYNVFKRKYLNTTGVSALKIAAAGGVPSIANCYARYNYIEDLTDQNIPAGSTFVQISGGLTGSIIDVSYNNVKSTTAYARSGLLVTPGALIGAGSKVNYNHIETESTIGIGMPCAEGNDQYFVGVEIIGNYVRGYRLNNPSDVGATHHGMLIRGKNLIVKNNFVSHNFLAFVLKSVGVTNDSYVFENNIAFECYVSMTMRAFNNCDLNNNTFAVSKGNEMFDMYDQTQDTLDVAFSNNIFLKVASDTNDNFVKLKGTSFGRVFFYNNIFICPEPATFWMNSTTVTYQTYAEAVAAGYLVDCETVDPGLTSIALGQLWPVAKLLYGKDLGVDRKTRLAIASDWNALNSKGYYVPTIATIADTDTPRQLGSYGL